MRSWFRVGLRLGVLAGAVFAVVLAARSRRGTTQPGTGPGRAGPDGATGVHGQWPDVRRAEAPVEGDHHPHGRVTVPREAAPLGAPPAVATDPPGPTEPEVPEPREHLDEETRPAPPTPAEAPGQDRPDGGPPAERRPAAKATTKAAAKAPAKKAPAQAATKAAPRAAEKATTKAAAKAPAKKAPARGQDQGGTGSPAPWLPPEGKGCPATHPVKAKLASRLYHLPGMLAYERTVPDRCYVDPAAAEADGFQRARR